MNKNAKEDLSKRENIFGLGRCLRFPPSFRRPLQRPVDFFDRADGGRMQSRLQPADRLLPNAGQLGQLLLGESQGFPLAET